MEELPVDNVFESPAGQVYVYRAPDGGRLYRLVPSNEFISNVPAQSQALDAPLVVMGTLTFTWACLAVFWLIAIR